MEDKYTISGKFLDDTIAKCSTMLVGLCMKRFEILQDKNAIKASIKELIYENYRICKQIIKSFDSGVRFVSKKTKEQD